MSRIILSKYPNGQQRVVVGWDHPAQGCFWQEFNLEPSEEEVAAHGYPEDWEEIARFGGMWPGIPYDDFQKSLPDDLRPMVTDEVMMLLLKAAEDPESGRWKPIDFSDK